MKDAWRFSAARRRVLGALAAAWAARGAAAPGAGVQAPSEPFATVVPGRTLRLPQDHGSHPAFRVEWWYVTGLLDASGSTLGFQITFFRARPDRRTGNPSAFAPHQILIGHAGLSDARERALLHQQRVARAGFGLADAAEGRTAVWIDDWRLEQTPGGYRMRLPFDGFAFDFDLQSTQPPLLNGEAGFSRKGPRPESASYYYSVPHLAVRGSVRRASGTVAVTGKAWLDHEWSSSYLDERADGWDWIGVNLDDGGAIMAFRIRARDGTAFWAGGTRRDATGQVRTYAPGEVEFVPLRHWRSPRTDARYPVSWEVRLEGVRYVVAPLFDEQEQDARSTTGTVYWEGAMHLLREDRRVGAGYLELTGYWRKLRV